MSPAPVFDLTKARRSQVRDELLDRIACHIPEREDVRTYPSGHIWTRRREHETLVLKVLRRRFR